jgi:ATP-dependent Lhr-like helicase
VFPAQVACQDNAPLGPIEIPAHPLVQQTLRDCLTEAMDLERLHGILEQMEGGDIRLHARDTTEPSPFSHEVLNAKPYAFLDDAPLEERRTRALSLRRTLPESQRDLGALDPEAIARVVREAHPAPRDADELHDAILGLVVAPIEEAWAGWLDELVHTGRAGKDGPLAFAMEHARTFDALYFGVAHHTVPSNLEGPLPARDAALLAVVRGHAEVCGPFTGEALARRLGLEAWEIDVAVARLENEGAVLRGRFTPGHDGEELCDRRLLARIHRLTLDRLRKEIEPVSAQDFLRYLFDRHHLTRRSRGGGRAGLREAIASLQGFEVAAAAWETEVLAPRIAGYRPEWLDELCLAGEVAWARLSPRRSATGVLGSTSRATPITLASRRDLGWLLDAVRGAEEPELPTSPSTLAALHALRRRGALFLDDLAGAATLDRGALTDALWDLVGRGLVTGDGFQPLRDLMASGRAARRRGRSVQGRWSVIERAGNQEPAARMDDDLADRTAGQLLARYGVVFRELSARESFSVPWRDVLRALRRREARGLVRGGRFVAGFVGEQYALPDAVDDLRRVRRQERTGEVVEIRAVDPLNLVGVLLPGPRVPAHPGERLSFRDGEYEGNSRRRESGSMVAPCPPPQEPCRPSPVTPSSFPTPMRAAP